MSAPSREKTRGLVHEIEEDRRAIDCSAAIFLRQHQVWQASATGQRNNLVHHAVHHGIIQSSRKKTYARARPCRPRRVTLRKSILQAPSARNVQNDWKQLGEACCRIRNAFARLRIKNESETYSTSTKLPRSFQNCKNTTFRKREQTIFTWKNRF